MTNEAKQILLNKYPELANLADEDFWEIVKGLNKEELEGIDWKARISFLRVRDDLKKKHPRDSLLDDLYLGFINGELKVFNEDLDKAVKEIEALTSDPSQVCIIPLWRDGDTLEALGAKV